MQKEKPITVACACDRQTSPAADEINAFYDCLEKMMAERARVRASGSTVTSAPA